MSDQEPRASTAAAASVYVHFPWCLAKCPYCDFVSYVERARPSTTPGYADAVLRELDARAPVLRRARSVESVFFGGGTPSLWEPRELGRVLARRPRALRRAAADARGHRRVQPDVARRGPGARAARRGRQPPLHRRPVARRRAAPLPRAPARRGGRERRRDAARSRGRAARLGGPHLRPPGPVARRGARARRSSSPTSGSRICLLPADDRAGDALRRARATRRLPLADDGARGRRRSSPSTRRSARAGFATTRSPTTPGRARRRATTSATGAATSTSASAAAPTASRASRRLRRAASAGDAASAADAGLRWRNEVVPERYVAASPAGGRHPPRAARRRDAPARAHHARAAHGGGHRPRGDRARPGRRRVDAGAPPRVAWLAARGRIVSGRLAHPDPAGGLALGRRHRGPPLLEPRRTSFGSGRAAGCRSGRRRETRRGATRARAVRRTLFSTPWGQPLNNSGIVLGAGCGRPVGCGRSASVVSSVISSSCLSVVRVGRVSSRQGCPRGDPGAHRSPSSPHAFPQGGRRFLTTSPAGVTTTVGGFFLDRPKMLGLEVLTLPRGLDGALDSFALSMAPVGPVAGGTG